VPIKLFVDTSGWASLFDARQPHHREATQLFTQFRQQQVDFITTNYVITELVALLHSPLRLTRPQIFQIVDRLKETPYLEIIHVDLFTDTAAWNLCKSRSDKAWSLVDCTSFVIMQLASCQVLLIKAECCVAHLIYKLDKSLAFRNTKVSTVSSCTTMSIAPAMPG
jgi:uncharacterized protein